MSECYKISLYKEEEVPLLPSIECAVVLTMSDSVRIHRKAFANITRLCRKTYVQRNVGYKHCRKPSCVVSPSTDLIHAYKNVCEEFHNVRGNVLILEDDAELMTAAQVRDFERVDRFLLSGKYDLYSLGSLGSIRHINRHHARVHGGFTQAIVWTPWAREKLLYTHVRKHIDGHFMTQQRTVTYKRPLVVQLFPKTENQNEWCVFCLSSLQPIDDTINALHRELFKRLRMDTSTEHWNTLYFVSKCVPILYVTACVAVAMYGSRALRHS
jgi:hypothetical protein